MRLRPKVWTLLKVSKKITVEISDDELEGLLPWLSRIETFKAFIPPGLLTLVRKIERAVKE
jgi:hypothetical protein